MSPTPNEYTFRPAGPPKTRAGKIRAMTRFAEERIAAAGSVDREAMLVAGFRADDVDAFETDVRDRLAARNALCACA